VKDLSRAEDVVHEVFARLLRQDRVLYFESDELCRAFLIKAVRHQCVDVLKQEERIVYTEEIAELSDGLGLGTAAPIDEILERETSDELYRAMMQVLQEHHRQVLFYHYFCDMSMKEIGACLQVSPKTVAVWAERGRNALRDYLEQEFLSRGKSGSRKKKGKEDGKA